MKDTGQIAKHLRDLHFGGNWTAVSLKDKLDGVTWQQATTAIGTHNTIAALVFHMNFFVEATSRVLQGGPLDAKDEFSFDCPPISSEADWESLLNKTWSDAEQLAWLIEKMPDEQLSQPFVDEKYGTYFRCLLGPIEHGYYHLGQISILKTLLQDGESAQAK